MMADIWVERVPVGKQRVRGGLLFEKCKLFGRVAESSKKEIYHLILKVYVTEYRLVNSFLIGRKEGVNITRLTTYSWNK